MLPNEVLFDLSSPMQQNNGGPFISPTQFFSYQEINSPELNVMIKLAL